MAFGIVMSSLKMSGRCLAACEKDAKIKRKTKAGKICIAELLANVAFSLVVNSLTNQN